VLGLERAGSARPLTRGTGVGTAPSIGTAFTALLLSAQDEALSEAIGCRHFPGKLSLAMTRAPSVAPRPPTRDQEVHPGPHADPIGASCLSLGDWGRMQSLSHPCASCHTSVARQSCCSPVECVPIPLLVSFSSPNYPAVPGHPLSPRLKLFSFPVSASQVRTLQSIMNIFASSILLPRLNGENLMGGMGLLE